MGENGKPTCFVVMGFGEKPDLATGRTLDLDKTYKYIIKPAAEEAGYECIRADDIQHAGVIDVPMYEWLLKADLVIADLSTSNVNAFFELGVRYALRPRTTIVIAEDNFRNPFDTNHITCRKFRHDGKALDIAEVERFMPMLRDAIRDVVAGGKDDSPVYTFIRDLDPPKVTTDQQAPAQAAEDLQERTRLQIEQADTEKASKALREPMARLMEQAALEREVKNFTAARAILQGVRIAQGDNVDDFVLQQLAFATYKSKQPSEPDALMTAQEILRALNPETSLDPETLGLWAAVHKRLAELQDRTPEQSAGDLDTAIDALERGFHLKHDYYNGINLAYLLNVRAARAAGDEAIADRIAAERIRKRVIPICENILAKSIAGENEKAKATTEYWVRASLAEAHLGLGDEAAADDEIDRAKGIPPPEDWMIETTERQIEKLKALIAS